MSEKCARCGTALPAEPPREGILHQIRIGRQTTTHTLHFQRWKFRWLPERAIDRARMFYTDLALCTPCAGDVFLFAQGLAPVSQPMSTDRPTRGNR